MLTRSAATVIATLREITYPQITPSSPALSWWFKVPPFGTILLLLVYLASLLALEFTNNDVAGGQHYTALGVRAAWLAVAQFPLLILLAGKNNLIGLFTGQSYERLNVLHRWVARGMLLLATLHFGYQSFGWSKYGIMQLEWATDTCPPTGMAAYALLLWLNLSTLAPIRNMWYEFFVIQHLITFWGFVIALMMHLPSTALYSRVYVYIPIALWFIDRVIRTSRYLLHNSRPSRATLTPLAGGVTKVHVTAPKSLKRWSPGAFVLLGIPKFGLGQSHPATILSTPDSHDGDLVFLLKSHKGFTARIAKAPSTDSLDSFISAEQDMTTQQPNLAATYTALLDGPYGTTPWSTDFATYTTLVLLAGSTGITYTLSHLLSIAYRAQAASCSESSSHLPLRTVHFVWLVKSLSHTTWLSAEMQAALDKLRAAGIEVFVRIYVTCDDTMTDASTSSGPLGAKISGCGCDKSLGPCCCTAVGKQEFNAVIRAFARQERSGLGAVEEKKRLQDAEEIQSLSKGRNAGGEKVAMPVTSVTRSSSSTSVSSAEESDSSRVISIATGRPDLPQLLNSIVSMPVAVTGETAVVCCGPTGLNSSIRNAVARVSDARAVHKGSGAQGIMLHVEGYSL